MPLMNSDWQQDQGGDHADGRRIRPAPVDLRPAHDRLGRPHAAGGAAAGRNPAQPEYCRPQPGANQPAGLARGPEHCRRQQPAVLAGQLADPPLGRFSQPTEQRAEYFSVAADRRSADLPAQRQRGQLYPVASSVDQRRTTAVQLVDLVGGRQHRRADRRRARSLYQPRP